VVSSRDRQRKLARAKVERQMARRAAKTRRRRQVTAAVSAGLVVVLAVLGTVWALGGFSSGPKKSDAASPCDWSPVDTAANPDLKDVGTPPTTGIQTSGTRTMTVTTDKGVITARLDAAKAPCTVASMSYLAGRQFFNDTKCHRLTTAGLYVLQCGDPSGKGDGGPSYNFATEWTPDTAASPAPSPAPSGPAPVVYPAGTVAMANHGPGTNGSQFFIVYKDSQLPPNYTAFGTVTAGLDTVTKVAASGAVDEKGQPTGDGAPKTPVTIQSVAVGDTAAAPAPTTPAASASPSAATNS
jgi:peptidyl-prolyl cis-trans isomerase B (cyclophilin B)